MTTGNNNDKAEVLKTQKTKVAEAISVAAHQLKTPISIIKGYLEELLSPDLGQEVDIKRGMALGANDYFVKTEVTLEEVVTRIKEWLK